MIFSYVRIVIQSLQCIMKYKLAEAYDILCNIEYDDTILGQTIGEFIEDACKAIEYAIYEIEINEQTIQDN
jgi:hypothetical protein